MTSIKMHPSELAYAFSYSEIVDIVGWGRDPFLPKADTGDDPKNWFADGAARLLEAGRLLETADKGLNFTDALTSDVLTLVDPTLVLCAERKVGNGLRRLTVHVGKDTVLGLSRGTDGMFELTHYADLTAAAIACVGFLGVALKPTQPRARIETSQEALSEIHRLASAAQIDPAIAGLIELGATEQDAASIVKAMADPIAAGVLSILYCAANVARDTDPFSVMTNADDETWILFPPANLQGPIVVEQSSVSALTARVVVGVAARLQLAA